MMPRFLPKMKHMKNKLPQTEIILPVMMDPNIEPKGFMPNTIPICV
jgi:hypothetical protein